MSWQAYVDNLTSTGQITKAAIVGHDGNVWAKSPALNASTQELQHLIKGFSNISVVQAQAPLLEGKKYMVVAAGDDDVINGKLGKSGFTAHKTNQAVLLGLYGDDASPGAVNLAVGKVADYLRSVGY